MKSIVITALAALAFRQAAAHATFQDLWVNGVDQISSRRSTSRNYRTDSAALPGNLCPTTTIQLTHYLGPHQRYPMQREWCTGSSREMCSQCRWNRHDRDAPGTSSPITVEL